MLRDKISLSRRTYGVSGSRSPSSPNSVPGHPSSGLPRRPTSPGPGRSTSPGRPTGNVPGHPSVPGRSLPNSSFRSNGRVARQPSSRLARGGRIRGRTRRAPLARTICAPLTSTDELLAWHPTASAARCVSRVPLPDSAVARYVRRTSSMPSTSAGKRIQPPASAVISGNFNHWAYVDVFVYFSHHRVTIPPVGYIHAAHRHGALALGTLIFEWDEGAADLHKMMSTYSIRAKAAQKLAKIAQFF
eukprot:IDg14486t1